LSVAPKIWPRHEGQLLGHRQVVLERWREPTVIPDEAIGQRKIWREVGTLACERERSLRLAGSSTLSARTTPSRELLQAAGCPADVVTFAKNSG
jgi:hypothetical protein